MPDKDLTPDQLQKMLNDYSEARRQEFELATADTPEDLEEHARNFFKQNIHSLAAQVVYLANNAESEAVRLNASKFGIEMALKHEKNTADPLRGLLEKLSTANN